MRQPTGRTGGRSRAESWWDEPGRPTPFLLWGMLSCGCGAAMVPLDRSADGAPQRLYRCDGGCGRPPVAAFRLETYVSCAVLDAALRHLPRYTVRTWLARRAAHPRTHPDRRRRQIRRWVRQVVVPRGRPPELHWRGPALPQPGEPGA